MEEHQRVVLTHTYTHRDGDILHTHLHEIHRAEQSKAKHMQHKFRPNKLKTTQILDSFT